MNAPLRRLSRPAASLVLAASLATVAGCGTGDLPDLGEVAGVVTNKGVPVAGSLVEFYPERGRPSMGRTDETGRYELVYTPGNPGAAVGTHSVRISPGSMVPPTAEAGPDAPPLPPMPKPKPGEDVITMPDKVEVKPGDNRLDFDLAASAGG